MQTLDWTIPIQQDTLNDRISDLETSQPYPDVIEQIQTIVQDFLSDLHDNSIPIEYIDTRLVGSNASYNYTEYSDLDVHIVANLSAVSSDPNILQLLYNYFRSAYNDKYDITIHGVPVEMYVEDVRATTRSNGMMP